MRRTSISSMLAGSFLILATNCYGANEYISFGQSASGNALATIHGNVLFCDALILYGFVGLPQVSVTQEDIAIESVAAGGECANPGPPPYPPPVPYQVTVGLGVLADGEYSVAWTYTLPPIVSPVMTAHAVLSVKGGEVAIFWDSFE
jgi:hypothetical protein